MHTHISPCAECLVRPCCTMICDIKIYFTAERMIRLSKYKKIDHDELMSMETFQHLMTDIWSENISISRRKSNLDMDVDGELQLKFDIAKIQIKKEIFKKTRYHNTKFCHSLFRKFNTRL